MRNNGRFTAAEEMIALGGGELFWVCDRNTRHKNVEFPGHRHASLFDVPTIARHVYDELKKYNIEVVFRCRITKAETDGGRINSVSDGERVFQGGAYIDATGTAGPAGNCVRYGNGCAMCVLRCHAFGGRVSLSGLCGVPQFSAEASGQSFGAMSGSCKLLKESLAGDIIETLNKYGVVVIPVPEELRSGRLAIKACQQYALPEFAENIVLLDTGHAKLMSPFLELETLHRIPGFESARYEDPYAGGIGNSMRYFEMCAHDEYLRADGVDNLFCAGEKVGPLVGHTEAIVTGTLAGHNAARHTFGKSLYRYPETLAVGDALKYTQEAIKTSEGQSGKITFSGSFYFERMKKLGLYTTDKTEIENRVKSAGAFKALER